MRNMTVQDLFRSEREVWLDEARATARRLLVSRPTITIEDVLLECPRPQHVHRNTAGQVFKHEDFTACGFAKSRRTISKGRWIMRWQLQAETMPHTIRQIRLAQRVAE